MGTVIFIIVVVWAICGVFVYGLTFAYFQREFPTVADEYYHDDQRFALFFAFMGPIGLAVSLSERKSHGLKWR